MHFKSYKYDLKDVLRIEKRSAQPNEKYIHELLLESNDEATTKMLLALFHQKITSPLLAAIFPMLSFLLILLSTHARRHSQWKAILLIAIIILFQGSYFWIANTAAKNLEFAKLNYALVISSLIILTALIIKKT
jgi:lipopolysaccharide export LptBFGC system permease protein LptF